MYQENIRIIKERASVMQKIIRVIFIIGVILTFVGLIVSVFLFFSSPERFSVSKGSLDWSSRYTLTNGSYFFINIPFKMIQPIDYSIDSNLLIAIYVAITSLFSVLISASFILYGLNQVLKILDSTVNDITPFIMDNVKSLKKLAYTIIIYSVAVDFLVSLLFTAFVTKIPPSITTPTIHSEVLIGGLILVIAEIFKYGVFLQKEFDATL